jgi:hypothetical protein
VRTATLPPCKTEEDGLVPASRLDERSSIDSSEVQQPCWASLTNVAALPLDDGRSRGVLMV